MDVVRVKWYDNVSDTEHVIDFTSDDFDCQTSMLTDIELVAATLSKCRAHQKEMPTHELLSIAIIAR
jgi:hypothetical protein